MKNYLLLVLLGIAQYVVSQSNGGIYGFSADKKYDDSFITPNLRGKHSISFGGLIGVYVSQTALLFGDDSNAPPAGNLSNQISSKSPIPSVGFYIGYNYLVLE